jgi:hypothetical protein
MKRAFLLSLLCMTFAGCGMLKKLDIPLSPREQSLYQSIEERMPLDSMHRYVSRIMLPSYPFVSKLYYSVTLYSSLDSLDQDTKDDVANSVLEFVMSKPKPFKQGKVVECFIRFYKQGDQSDDAFLFYIDKEVYKKR